jgi:transcriptional regulator with XRE-family HTH domain
MADARANKLGEYLKSRRAKLDPAEFGVSGGRRRTPGLRREEVAQRASISAAWYTLLEQGRGGSPSAEALDRIARALTLTEAEREHLFLLGLGRLPEARYRAIDVAPPRLQRLLDALTSSPAMLRTATWDVVAWNRAAAVVLWDFAALPASERNLLRLMFCDPRVRAAQLEHDGVARFAVGAFRAQAARAGATADAEPLVRELCERSPEFAGMWRDLDVPASAGDGLKRVRHPELGPLTLEISSFAVDGRPDLEMVVLHPMTAGERRAIRAHIARSA